MRTDVVALDAIKVDGRFRQDLGDLGPLASSIAETGLLHPIVVTSDMRLVAGQRRLEALRMLGESEVEVRIADDLDGVAQLLVAERDENTCRKDMAASELYALGKALDELERPKARERQASHGAAPGRPVNTGDQSSTSVKTRDVVAPAVGLSGPQWGRLKHIGDRAAEGDEAAADTLAKIDQGEETVSGGYTRLRQQDVVKSPAKPKDNGHVRTKTFKGRDVTEGTRRVINTLVGLTPVLSGIEPSELEPTADEAAQWKDDLVKARRAITQLINRL